MAHPIDLFDDLIDMKNEPQTFTIIQTKMDDAHENNNTAHISHIKEMSE